MNSLLCALSLAVLFLALAIFANRSRRTHALNFSLQPNCLLTRHPVVFLTGRRSVFYFSRYWNLYPVFLAEHGYEVFTVHLPWRAPTERRKRLEQVLQKESHKKFHFVMDEATWVEFQEVLTNHKAVASITRLREEGDDKGPHLSNEVVVPRATASGVYLISTAYKLHSLGERNAPGLNALGALPTSALDNSHLLLARMQHLAEEDYTAAVAPQDI